MHAVSHIQWNGHAQNIHIRWRNAEHNNKLNANVNYTLNLAYNFKPISLLGRVYQRTYVLHLLLIFSFFPLLLALRSQNQRINGSWVCYKQLGVWCNFNSRNWILSLVPFFGRWGNCPKFCRKLHGALIWCIVITKQLNMWEQEIFFRKRDNHPTFWWQIRKPPFTRFRGGVADLLYQFHLRAWLALLSFTRWHCY